MVDVVLAHFWISHYASQTSTFRFNSFSSELRRVRDDTPIVFILVDIPPPFRSVNYATLVPLEAGTVLF